MEAIGASRVASGLMGTHPRPSGRTQQQGRYGVTSRSLAQSGIISGGYSTVETDAGGCCDYDSVIGNEKDEPLRRFTTRISGGRYTPASGPATVCGVFVETDDRTGLATRVEPIRVGGRLSQAVPVV